jgi:hypothetical protein
LSKVGLYWRLLQGVVENAGYYYFVFRRSAYNKTAGRLAQNDLPENGTFYPVKLDPTATLKRKLKLQVIEGVVRELVPHGLGSWTGLVEDYRDFEEEAKEIVQAIRRLKTKDYNFFVQALPSIPSAMPFRIMMM